MDAGRGFLLDQCDGQIQFILFQKTLQFRMVSLAQGDFEGRILLANILKQLRQMIAQHDGRGADADLPGLPSLQLCRHGVQVGKERLDEPEQFFPLGCESKWPALKQRDTKKLFQLAHLAAHRRLLDAIRNIAHRLHDSPMASNVIEKFEVVNVHFIRSEAGPNPNCRIFITPSLEHSATRFFWGIYQFKQCQIKFYQLTRAAAMRYTRSM